MKNNKGFTLIELMGILVVMAVILGIAYPVYNEITKQNKDDLFRDNLRSAISIIRTINVVEFQETYGCLKNIEAKGTRLTGSWELSEDSIIIHNVSDGIRSIINLSEDDLNKNFNVERQALAETCS